MKKVKNVGEGAIWTYCVIVSVVGLAQLSNDFVHYLMDKKAKK